MMVIQASNYCYSFLQSLILRHKNSAVGIRDSIVVEAITYLNAYTLNQFYQFLKQKRLELATQIEGRIIIYLDLNYWIRLRDIGQQSQPEDQEFLEKVIELADTKRCIFPMSEMTFYEIMKQSDINTRDATIRLVDRLSQGLAIIDMRERAALETRIWLLKARAEQVHEAKELVWTSLAFALGHDQIIMLPTEELRIAAFEYLSSLSLACLTERITEVFNYKDNVELFNANFRKYAHQNKTYHDLLLTELTGIIDGNAEILMDVVDHLHYMDRGRYMSVHERSDNKPIELLVEAFKSGIIKDELPLFHIIATLHAWTRWKQKPFKDGNDTIDFYHASFALPYTHYFFTDRRLANSIKECKLDTLYDCLVEWDIDKVRTLIAAL